MAKQNKAEGTAPTTEQTQNLTDEQAKNVADLNAKSDEKAPPAPPAKPTRDELVKAKNDAKAAWLTATDEKAEHDLGLAYWKAVKAVDELDAAEKAEADKKAAMEKLETAKNIIAEAFGISRETLDAVLATKPADEQGRENPVFHAITTVFGKPVVYAKQGQTGKQLTGNASANGKPAGGQKSAEILAMMEQGKSYNEIYAAGYGDGTIRTVATDNGFIKSIKGDNSSPYVKKQS